MKLPRLSIAKLMAVIGLVAINLAAGRVLLSYDPILLTGIALPLIILQVGLYRMIRRRGRVRIFWAGLIACGLGAMMSFYWAMAFPKGVGRYVEPATGKIIELVSPGSAMWTLWSRYDEFANSCLEHLPLALEIDPDADGIVPVVTISLVWSLPQLLIALAGGLLACLVVPRLWQTNPRLTSRPQRAIHFAKRPADAVAELTHDAYASDEYQCQHDGILHSRWTVLAVQETVNGPSDDGHESASLKAGFASTKVGAQFSQS